MESLETRKLEIEENGFAVIDKVFTDEAADGIINFIDSTDKDKPTFRKTDDLFAIRQFLKEVPGIKPFIFTSELQYIIQQLFGSGYFVVKSIYFDKPSSSNWFVAYHQDLTISTASKQLSEGFINWTVKQGQYAVQPPVEVLQRNFTIRIHLDDTDEDNGALRVIPGTHLKRVIAPKDFKGLTRNETVCSVQKGGIMIMKPLLLHASGRTINNKRRRVVHIEMSDAVLPEPLEWGEKAEVFCRKN